MKLQALGDDLDKLHSSYPAEMVVLLICLALTELVAFWQLVQWRWGILRMIIVTIRILFLLLRLLVHLMKGLILEVPMWTVRMHIGMFLVALAVAVLAHPLLSKHYTVSRPARWQFWDDFHGFLSENVGFALIAFIMLLPGLLRLFFFCGRMLIKCITRLSSVFSVGLRIVGYPVPVPIIFAVGILVFTGFGSVWLFSAVLLLFVIARAILPRQRKHIGNGEIIVDDVTRMSATVVSRVFYVRSAADIQHVILRARREQRQVSIRGTKHSMGGHTIAKGGFVIDNKWMTNMMLDETTSSVVVEPGAKWEAVIQYLNSFGMAPRTLQSYCSFSVGGTVAVNAHGITSDFCMAESVLEINYIDAHGAPQQCRQGDEMFSFICGGYGLFGAIYSLRLKAVPNTKMTFEMINTTFTQFTPLYEAILHDSSVEVKICRINLVTFNDIQLWIFRRSAVPSKILPMALAENASSAVHQRTVSDLPDLARGQSPVTRLLYKWVAPSTWGRRLRYLVEELRGSPVTGLQHAMSRTGTIERNVMLFETADPLAQLYNPIVTIDDTFVLQEYFVPHDQGQLWMVSVRDILRHVTPGRFINLLNITIRYVMKDSYTRLPYAKVDVFAFVLYYRLRRTLEAEAELEKAHHALVKVTSQLGGTFYLPYRHHYSPDELLAAYPEVTTFFQKKLQLDPVNLFSNAWFEDYGTRLGFDCSLGTLESPMSISAPSLQGTPADGAGEDGKPLMVPARRHDSYFRVMKSDALRRKLGLFLQHVFKVIPESIIFPIINRATWNPENSTDKDVYAELCASLQRFRGVLSSCKRARRGLQNLKEQRCDFTQQLLAIFSQAGVCGFHSICSIGDAGKVVPNLLNAYGMMGPVWLLYEPGKLDPLERGSLMPIGRTIRFSYREALRADLDAVPSDSVDVVLSMPGLHHIHSEDLGEFLCFVQRILRPGGLFIFREHDGIDSLKPLLDIAHSVFNAVTGVSQQGDEGEIRAFRSLEGWRSIVTAQGFEDMMLYGMDDQDPTEDIMLCFRKIGDRLSHALEFEGGPSDPVLGYYKWTEWALVEMSHHFAAFMQTNVWYRFPYLEHIALFWRLTLEAFLHAQKSHSLRRAFSFGLVMDMIIGIVATLLLLLLWFLSLPLRSTRGSYTKEIETLVVELEDTGEPPPSLAYLHAAMHGSFDIRLEELRPGRLRLILPSQFAFTGALVEVAKALPKARLSEVTGSGPESPATMRVSIAREIDVNLQWLRKLPGVEVLYKFSWPSPPPGRQGLQVILRVAVMHLLEVVQKITSQDSCPESVFLEQVYDFGLQKDRQGMFLPSSRMAGQSRHGRELTDHAMPLREVMGDKEQTDHDTPLLDVKDGGGALVPVILSSGGSSNVEPSTRKPVRNFGSLLRGDSLSENVDITPSKNSGPSASAVGKATTRRPPLE